jgi:GntR family transcriptional regulator
MDAPEEHPLFRPTERFTLDAESPVPLYHQIERTIVERMAGKNVMGRMLPAETELMQMFKVSRATARKAYEGLVAKGVIERRRALGTRVVGSGRTEDLARLKSYTEEMDRKGLKTSTEVIEATVHTPTAAVRERLGLGAGERTLLLRRLRGTSEFFPIVYLTSEIPVSFGLSPKEDFSTSLYQLLEAKYRIPIEWADEEIRVGKANATEGQLLRIAPGEGVLVMERITYTKQEKPLEFVRAVYRPEHYTFSIRLRR